MTDFTRPISGFRFVQTHHGDTLHRVALRELGDAGAWAKLVWLNKLVPPYLTDDIAQVREGVILNGGSIRVPAATAEVDAGAFPDEVFLADCKLSNGRLQLSGGDIELVSGRANLRQAIEHRLVTDHGDLMFHPRYGTNLGPLIGALSGPVRELVAQDYVNDSLMDENRIKEVTQITVSTQGDRLEIAAEVAPISGANVNVSKVV